MKAAILITALLLTGCQVSLVTVEVNYPVSSEELKAIAQVAASTESYVP